MNAATRDIDRRVRDLMARTSPLRRLAMASGMFHAARELALAGRPDTEPDARAYLFRRFYQRDFSASERMRIVEYLRRGKR